MSDNELLSALSTLIDEKLDQKLEENNKKLEAKLEAAFDQKLEANNKKLKAAFDQKLEAAFDQKLTPIYQRLDNLEYQIKQTEYNLRNEIRRTEKLLLNEIERVHIILDQHINDPRMHPCLTEWALSHKKEYTNDKTFQKSQKKEYKVCEIIKIPTLFFICPFRIIIFYVYD